MAVRSIQGITGGIFNHGRLIKFIPSIIIAVAVLVFVSAILVIFSGLESSFTPLTNKCISCHNDTGSKDTIHPIKYIQNTGIFNASKTSAVNCNGCHRTQFSGFPKVPIIPDFTHSNTLSSGRKWGNYWDNASIITAC